MPAGSNTRTVARLLASAGAPLWIITAARKIGYVSEAAALWLGVDGNTLVDRDCNCGTSASNDPLDQLAASLSPPAGLTFAGSALLRVQPIEVTDNSVAPKNVLFVRIGQDTNAITLAVAGEFSSTANDFQIADSVVIRQHLDAWRKRHAALAVTASAGTSSAAKRLRARLQIAAKIRCHLGFFGPTGCGSESLAVRIHSLSAAGEQLVIVDGPLMDSELLEATIAPAINEVTESSTSTASVLVRALDEMPIEAQSRLAEVIASAGGRLRLIGLCGLQPQLFQEPIVENAAEVFLLGDEINRVIEARLAEYLSALHVMVEPLRRRVEDLPLLSAALLDARHAVGDGPAERLSRTALDAIVTYPWPGDFAELDAAIRHAIRSSSGDIIGIEQLPLAVRSYRVGASRKNEPQTVDLDEAVRRHEWKLIQETLASTDGNRAEAARRLGISRARLLRKIDEAEAVDTEDAS